MAYFQDASYYLQKIRDPLADYQEQKGVPREELYSFLSLLTTLCQHSYNAFVVIFAMLYNLSPMMDSILCVLRFLLDKMIEISQTQNLQERTHKVLIFVGQLSVLGAVGFMIYTLIIFPIVNLISAIALCTWGWINPHMA
ncbi:uncharacterized protein LOC123315608 [Coccinella septempunctata]|uniref:uncharacterized protein LOC123315608 n=1 Tax=Coccinella septempunctata TaxID=41139 RepID=UPI001D08A51E|nr:uncharacterized protein LOC123315608 [Coccinella septempunctata]